MNIQLVTKDEEKKWDQFVQSNQPGSFLHSWVWTEFVEKTKSKVWRYAIENEQGWVATIFLMKDDLKFNLSFLYSPHGPVIKNDSVAVEKILEIIDQEVTKIAKEENSLYYQIDPLTNQKKYQESLSSLGFHKAELNVQPRYTLILGLNPSEEELLQQMHHKTRYNIRLAGKKGVKIVLDNSKVDDFFRLLQLTEKKKGVKFYNKKYFEELLKLPIAKLYLAEYEGKLIAANIIISWGDTSVYLFGGTNNQFRKVMAPQLLQWQAIKDAKTSGKLYYDFWGAAPKDVTGHEQKWAGVTRFKQGFDPHQELTKYLGTYEKVYQPLKLKLYRGLKKIVGK